MGGDTTAGYAIPVDRALSIAQQIRNNIVIGYPAFLGVQVSSTTTGFRSRSAVQGAVINGVLTDTPAETAGLVAGDVITAVDGATISTPTDLTEALAEYSPGQDVTISWVGVSGAKDSATVTLASGPAL